MAQMDRLHELTLTHVGCGAVLLLPHGARVVSESSSVYSGCVMIWEPSLLVSRPR